MKKVIRPFVIEYRSKRGRSRVARGGESFRFTDQSSERIFSGKEAHDGIAAWPSWRSLFKQEERAP
jgi:hypothetical protein